MRLKSYYRNTLYICNSQCFPRARSFCLSWKRVRNLEMQVLESHARLTKSDPLGVGPSRLCFNKPSIGFQRILNFENHCFI